MKHVILGCGIAGITAAETLRRHDSTADIVMIADEPYYYRAALSFFMKGMIEEQELYGKPEGWHSKVNIDMKQATVSAIDTQNKSISLENGESVKYERLLIATGARPFVVPWPGVDLEGVCTFRSLYCVKRFRRHVQAGAKKAVVIGGGILGVEMVDDFVQMGLEVTVLVRDTQVLNLLFDGVGARIIEKQMESDGVDIRFETEVERFEGTNGKLSAVVLKSGEDIQTDLVGIAIGIRANVEFLKGSDINVDRAVLVDTKLRTSVQDIYTAGDVCAIHDPSASRYRPTRTWLPSALQGETATLNMLGKNTVYDEGVFFNASHAYRSMYAVLGKFHPPSSDDFEFVVCTHDEENYEKLVIKENRIVGAMFIGSMKNVWPIKQLIEARVDISPICAQLCNGLDVHMLLPDEYAILF